MGECTHQIVVSVSREQAGVALSPGLAQPLYTQVPLASESARICHLRSDPALQQLDVRLADPFL